jgi:hypothetical protein
MKRPLDPGAVVASELADAARNVLKVFARNQRVIKVKCPRGISGFRLPP